MIISLSTLIVFAYQTNLIRKQQYMSVYPHLNLVNYNSGSINYKYVLRNEGVGPGFISDIVIRETGGPVYESFVEYLEQKITKKDSIEFHYSDLYKGRLIQADEEIILFGLSGHEYTRMHGLPRNTIRSANKLYHILNSLEVKITYESIYGESWSITHDSEIPIKN